MPCEWIFEKPEAYHFLETNQASRLPKKISIHQKQIHGFLQGSKKFRYTILPSTWQDITYPISHQTGSSENHRLKSTFQVGDIWSFQGEVSSKCLWPTHLDCQGSPKLRMPRPDLFSQRNNGESRYCRYCRYKYKCNVHIHTSRAARGGGGSFKNRKRIGEDWLFWITDDKAKTLMDLTNCRTV